MNSTIADENGKALPLKMTREQIAGRPGDRPQVQVGAYKACD